MCSAGLEPKKEPPGAQAGGSAGAMPNSVQPSRLCFGWLGQLGS